MDAILQEQTGHYNYGKNDALILFQKGFWGATDESIAKMLRMTPEKFSEEKEKLIYRHIKCNFTGKSQLANTFSVSEEEITNIYNKIDNLYKKEKTMPSKVEKLEHKITSLERRVRYLEARLEEK